MRRLLAAGHVPTQQQRGRHATWAGMAASNAWHACLKHAASGRGSVCSCNLTVQHRLRPVPRCRILIRSSAAGAVVRASYCCWSVPDVV